MPHPGLEGRPAGRRHLGLVRARDRGPGTWAGRRIALEAEYLNSYAAVFVDGKKAGEVRFPGGELDLTAAVPARWQAPS